MSSFFLDVEGAKLRSAGESLREVPTLLLLYGGPGFDHSEFKVGFSQLAEIAQIVYLDHRGNGRSESGDLSGGPLRGGQMMFTAFAKCLKSKSRSS